MSKKASPKKKPKKAQPKKHPPRKAKDKRREERPAESHKVRQDTEGAPTSKQARSDTKGRNGRVGAALVVGGGVGGIQAALDLAESGIKVYVVEKGPSIGGAMSQLDKTFPTNDCSLCILSPKMVEAGRHRNIELLTCSELTGLDGEPGNFRARVLRRARSVDMAKCTGCGTCAQRCLVRNRIKEGEPVHAEPDEKVASIVERYDGDVGMLIPMMQDMQEEFGYLAADKLKILSQSLGVPLPRIFSVATFFASLRLQPIGEHTVTLCMGTVCYLRGSDRISEAIQQEFEVKPNGTSPDGKLTLLQVNCLGACALAPVMVVDGEYHGGLSVGSAVDLLHKVAAGEVVAGAAGGAAGNGEEN